MVVCRVLIWGKKGVLEIEKMTENGGSRGWKKVDIYGWKRVDIWLQKGGLNRVAKGGT